MDKRIEIRLGDITRIPVDAIVNAANHTLRGGGGVDGAIHRAGGPAILDQCIQIGECPTGQAVITTAGFLPALHVIHTVGPVWFDGKHGEPEQLRSCYRNSLQLAKRNKVRSLAFPSISTGIYGYPREAAARIAIEEVGRFLAGDRTMKQILFVCFDEETYGIYRKLTRGTKGGGKECSK